MDLYTKTSYQVSELITRRYSTSFSSSILLFDASLRPHIYAIYGLVRIADEIVDTYRGDHARELLDSLEKQVNQAQQTGFSPHPVIHAYVQTSQRYHLDDDVLAAFFESMRMDLTDHVYTKELFKKYVYGSAEAVGLLCLRVFVDGDDQQYKRFYKAARALGACYQKVNFLRDIAADHAIGRFYFPGYHFDTLTESHKLAIVADIEKDIAVAKKGIKDLPNQSRKAVTLSLYYYQSLLNKLRRVPIERLKTKRIRISNVHKLFLLLRATLSGGKND